MTGGRTGTLLWRVATDWQSAQRAALRPLGLTPLQLLVLTTLLRLDGEHAPTQRDLAGLAGTDETSTSHALRALESLRLVVREPHPRDGRARALRTTPAGLRLVERATAALERAERDFFAGLGAERARFTALLAELSAR